MGYLGSVFVVIMFSIACAISLEADISAPKFKAKYGTLVGQQIVSLEAEKSVPKFKTEYGTMVGQQIQESDVFLGVPFAKPPVGELRFKDPEPLKKSREKVFEAKTKRPDCMQSGISASKNADEDCLYMNIYKPSRPTTKYPLPVLVFLPGGNFIAGGCWDKTYDATILAPNINAIVVCANYRLGALGFLYYKDDKEGTEGDILGNFGMKDQIAALKFVRENIKSIGGDPDKITLAGQRAGAQSVAVHLTSGEDNDLFQQAILMSGPLSISLKSEEEALKLGTKFLRKLRCEEPVLSCLRNKNAKDITKASERFVMKFKIWQMPHKFVNNFENKVFHAFQPWGPTVVTQPITQFKRVDKPVMIGSLSGDGKMFSFPPLDDFPQIALNILLPDYSKTVLEKYQGWYKSDDIFAHFLTDYLFTCPARSAALDMSSRSVYSYYFDHALSFATVTPPRCRKYACHGKDVLFFFQSASLLGFKFTKDEEKLLDIYSTYLANFIHHGDPNKISYNVQPKDHHLSPWRPIDSKPENLWTLVFTTKEPVISKLGIKKDQCDFWDGIGYYNVARLNRK